MKDKIIDIANITVNIMTFCFLIISLSIKFNTNSFIGILSPTYWNQELTVATIRAKIKVVSIWTKPNLIDTSNCPL